MPTVPSKWGAVHEANRRRDDTQHQIHDLLDSRSWKIAAPFRSAGTIARKARNALNGRYAEKSASIAGGQALTLDGFVRSHPRLLLVNAASSSAPDSDDAVLALAKAAAEAGYGVIFIGWQ